MNLKQELIDRVIKAITDTMRVRGKSFDEAVEIVRQESAAGPAVWTEVLASFEK